MNKLVIEEKECLDYIESKLTLASKDTALSLDGKYHHNTKYELMSSILKHGLLHLRDLNELGIYSFSESFLNTMSDTASHINGDDGISLSVSGLTDINDDEEEYDSRDARRVDIIIDSSIKAYRNSTNYANEYITFDSIEPSKFKSIDIRLHKLIKHYIERKKTDTKSLEEIISNYNALIEIASSLVKYSLDIPLREMSYEGSELDIVALSENKKLVLK